MRLEKKKGDKERKRVARTSSLGNEDLLFLVSFSLSLLIAESLKKTIQCECEKQDLSAAVPLCESIKRIATNHVYECLTGLSWMVFYDQIPFCNCAPMQLFAMLSIGDYENTRHLCRIIGISMQRHAPPEGIHKLRSLMFPVLARAAEMQQDAAAAADAENEY